MDDEQHSGARRRLPHRGSSGSRSAFGAPAASGVGQPHERANIPALNMKAHGGAPSAASPNPAMTPAPVITRRSEGARSGTTLPLSARARSSRSPRQAASTRSGFARRRPRGDASGAEAGRSTSRSPAAAAGEEARVTVRALLADAGRTVAVHDHEVVRGLALAAPRTLAGIGWCWVRRVGRPRGAVGT